MEEEIECCVCLQGYEEEGEHVPQVLGCGHTLCRDCIVRLARGHDQQQQQHKRFVRCPECSHVTSFASLSSLPKNIELLRLCGKARRPRACPPSSSPAGAGGGGTGQFVLRDLLNAFPGSVNIRSPRWSSGDVVLHGQLGDDGQDVSLYCLAESGSRTKRKSFVAAKDGGCREEAAAKVWQKGLSQTSRKETIVLLRIASLSHAACTVLGMWLSDDDSKLYLVNNIPCRSTSLASLIQRGSWTCSSSIPIVDVALQLCEIVTEIHGQGMVLGLLGPEMFQVSQFGRIFVHWNRAMELRRAMHRSFLADGDEDNEATRATSVWHFTSPEVLSALSVTEPGCCLSEVKESSDVWSLACFLLHLILSRPSPSLPFKQARDDAEQKQLVLRGECKQDDPLQEFLLSCLAVHPGDRPTMGELLLHLKSEPGNPCQSDDNSFSTPIPIRWCFSLHGLDMVPKEENEQVQEQQQHEAVDSEVLQLRETAMLKGHTACITCLGVCGTSLVSASFDKSVRVWSLEDGSLLWSWEGGHSQRIQALVVDEASQMCYSGDYGGSVCAWKVSQPFQEHPVAKWQEHDDWRFTGVSSLALSDDGILYSGSGDMLVKAWCTETHNLLGTFTGHRGLVSCLAVDGGLLYSGSWDGCVRIWSRSDFSSVGVLETGGDPVRALVVSSDDEAVVCGLDNGCIQVWKDLKRDSTVKLHEGPVSCLALISKPGYLCTGSWDKSLMVLHLEDGVKGDDHVKSITCDDAVVWIVYNGLKLYVASGSSIKVLS